MHLRSTKKINAEVSLEDPIGKDKDDNTITLQDVLENNEKNIEEEVDIKLKMKKIYEKMKNILKDREKLIIEMRFGLDGAKPKTQNQIAKILGISRSYVSRIETKAIGKLSKEIKEWKRIKKTKNCWHFLAIFLKLLYYIISIICAYKEETEYRIIKN